MTADEFVEMCEKLKKLGVSGFRFEGYEASFYPPEPAFNQSPAEVIKSRFDAMDEETGTPAGRRESIRRQIAKDSEDLYGGAG